MSHGLKRVPRRQLGGTFLGLILGLLIGLGGALAVAVYVAKVPTPFANKNPARTAEQEAAEAEKNKTWNPNAAMQSKVPVKPLPNEGGAGGAPTDDRPLVKPVEGKDAIGKDGKPDYKSETPAAKEAKPAADKGERKPDEPRQTRADGKASDTHRPSEPSADPIGDFAKAQSSQPRADPFIYQVQTGAFRSSDEAESQRAKLALQGVDARVTEREQSGRTVFRVRTGTMEQRGEAERMRDRLTAAGFDAVLVRIQR